MTTLDEAPQKLTPLLLEQRVLEIRQNLDTLMVEIVEAVPGDGGECPDTTQLVDLLQKAFDLVPQDNLEKALDAPAVQRERRQMGGQHHGS